LEEYSRQPLDDLLGVKFFEEGEHACTVDVVEPAVYAKRSIAYGYVRAHLAEKA